MKTISPQLSPLILGLTLIFVAIQNSESAAAPKPRVLNKHEKLVIFSFDGFRHDYLYKASAPTLNSLKADGVSTHHMQALFMSKTFVNHQAFATGLYSESNGIVDNVFFDPVYNSSLSGFDSYNDEFWNYDERVMPIWILNEMAGDGRISGVQFPGANQEYGPNKALPTHYLSYNGSRPYEQRMDDVFSWLTNETHPANLVFMYFEQPDSAGHAYGPESDEVKRNITILDNVTKYLLDKLEAAGILDEINFMFWSDHGMQEVNVGNRINLTALVPSTQFKREGGSPVWHIRPNAGFENEVYWQFKNASVGRGFSVYNKSEIPAKWNYRNNRRIGDIIVVADPGFVFDDFRYWITDHPDTKFGVHGYDNEDTDMKPFFFAYGPRFKQNYQIDPFDTVDLFPMIASLMGFEPSPHNGSLAKVSGMIRASEGKGVLLKPSTFLIVVVGQANELKFWILLTILLILISVGLIIHTRNRPRPQCINHHEYAESIPLNHDF